MKKEVDQLMLRILTIQDAVGVKEDKEKKKTGGNADRFMELKAGIVERVHNIKLTVDEMNSRSGKKQHPREVIAQQQAIREDVKKLDVEWKELNALYEMEIKKKKSKFSKEELELRKDIVRQYAAELTKIKEVTSTGYLKFSNPSKGSAFAKYTAQERSNLFSGSINGSENGQQSEGGVTFSGGKEATEEISHEQKEILLQIENNDRKFDRMVDQIGEGVMELGVLARGINEEVVRQNAMIDGLEERIDNANEHVISVNDKMKETLEKVGRSADKCMVDFICLILLLGIATVLYNLVFKKSS